MNTCGNRECQTTILDSKRFCLAHKNPPKRRNKKNPQKRNAGMFDASGKVRANQGLARLKEQDRLRWEAEQKAAAKDKETIVKPLTDDERMQIAAEMSKL